MEKEYQQTANTFLENNITLDDNIEGVPVEYSNKLYEETSNFPSDSKCDSIKAVNTQGWDDYACV